VYPGVGAARAQGMDGGHIGKGGQRFFELVLHRLARGLALPALVSGA
jgi:hypothetical protein